MMSNIQINTISSQKTSYLKVLESYFGLENGTMHEVWKLKLREMFLNDGPMKGSQ